MEKIYLLNIRSKKYDAEIDREGEYSDTCFLCGKRTAGKFSVHYTTHGYLINSDNDEIPASENVGESQGFFNIGPECAKKLDKSFIF